MHLDFLHTYSWNEREREHTNGNILHPKVETIHPSIHSKWHKWRCKCRRLEVRCLPLDSKACSVSTDIRKRTYLMPAETPQLPGQQKYYWLMPGKFIRKKRKKKKKRFAVFIFILLRFKVKLSHCHSDRLASKKIISSMDVYFSSMKCNWFWSPKSHNAYGTWSTSGWCQTG